MGFNDVFLPGIRRVIITAIMYIIMIFFVLPYFSIGKTFLNPFSIFSLVVLVYSYFVSVFVDAIVKGGNNKRWFFE